MIFNLRSVYLCLIDYSSIQVQRVLVVLSLRQQAQVSEGVKVSSVSPVKPTKVSDGVKVLSVSPVKPTHPHPPIRPRYLMV